MERVVLPSGRRVIFKYALEPFCGEADVIRHLQGQGFPVAGLVADVRRDDRLGMLLEDLGEPVRDATDDEGAESAVATHAVAPPPGLAVLDRAGLAALPVAALASLDTLRSQGRWTGTGELDVVLGELADAAHDLAGGAEVAPFGLVHSEFHPTSLHLGAGGWRLLDWARAFVGPGLLDLASWQGTTSADVAALRAFIDRYVQAGGAPKRPSRAQVSPQGPGHWDGTGCGSSPGTSNRPTPGCPTRRTTRSSRTSSDATSTRRSHAWA